MGRTLLLAPLRHTRRRPWVGLPAVFGPAASTKRAIAARVPAARAPPARLRLPHANERLRRPPAGLVDDALKSAFVQLDESLLTF